MVARRLARIGYGVVVSSRGGFAGLVVVSWRVSTFQHAVTCTDSSLTSERLGKRCNVATRMSSLSECSLGLSITFLHLHPLECFAACWWLVVAGADAKSSPGKLRCELSLLTFTCTCEARVQGRYPLRNRSHYDPAPRRIQHGHPPREMAAAKGGMRLSVDVLPLAEENSHGPYRDVALTTFKGRQFALPVQLDDTIEHVWAQIDERYKRNYLTPEQAA